MIKFSIKSIFKINFILISTFLFSCQPQSGTSTGNPLVRVNFQSFTSLVSRMSANPQLQLTKKLLDQNSYESAALSVMQLKFCFKRIRFKTLGETTSSDPTQDSDNIDFYIGEVSLNNSGTYLSDISLPVGTYSRVEFDLEDDCTSRLSVDLMNNQGQFVTDQRITIKFDGTYTHTSEGGEINLSPQVLINALNAVNANSQIKPALESVNGSF